MGESGRLAGKAAIVTGGSNGIGRAICELFAREGCMVLNADRDRDSADEVNSEIRRNRGESAFVHTDVSKESDVERAVNAACDSFGRLDILVNCAGIALAGTVVDTDYALWQRVLDVNLAAAYLTSRHAIPRMMEAGGGSIVNVASLQGLYGYPNWAAYAASKAGLIGLTRQTAVDFRASGIRCNAISPGAILTDLGGNTARLEAGFMAESASDIDVEKREATERPVFLRPGRPIDIAYVALFLASDESRHITGHNLVVDGGASSRLE